MNHLQLKNSILSDLQLITDMAVEDIKNNNPDDFELMNDPEGWSKNENERICYAINGNYPLLPFDMTLTYGTAKYYFPIAQAPKLHTAVKNKWGNGKTRQPGKGMNCVQDRNKSMQREIMELRNQYIGNFDRVVGGYKWIHKDWCKKEEWEELLQKEKNKVIRQYQNAEPGDLIRLCWRFITNPENLEGVHYSWIDPQVKFEPYREVSEMPKFADKLLEVA